MKKRCRKSNKVKFDSHEKAAIRAGEIITGPNATTDTLSTYLCPFCNKWHLTSVL